jgi:glyoxylase-like metal-dependent hydrolase (beta-lactamase superfamily II)
MLVFTNTGGVASTNCFLIADEKAGRAALLDAPDHTIAPLLGEIARRGWELCGLWLTHGHFDHFADHAEARRAHPNAQRLIHQLDEAKALRPDYQTRLFGLPLVIPPFQATGYVTDGQELAIGGIRARVLHTPGHSPGHVSYHFPDEGALVGGDLIIGGSVGRTDLPDSVHADLEASIRRVMALPPQTRLLGGHGPESTLEDEARNNPYVRMAMEL